MKKVLVTLLLGVSFVMSSFASSEVKNKTTLLKGENEVIKELKVKPVEGICGEVYIYTIECPDGSIYIPSIDVVLFDCDTEELIVAFDFQNEEDYSDFCD